MKITRMTSVLLLLTLVLFSGAAVAQEIATKIAFVNTTEILQGTAEGKAELAAMEQYVSSTRSELGGQNAELEDLKKTYNSQMRMLNPDTAAEMQRQISEKERTLRRAQEDLELEATQRQNQLLNKMSQKIRAVIAEYAEQNGYGAVFLDSPSMPFYAETLNITGTIIQIYDQKNPVAAPAAPAGP
ncbi:MAG: OmpH family outer membrane protein [Acidobacteriota bacterium]|nr:MAG: OmpH family outer membrane protein [Acidobacteriota bacterium]